MDGQSDAVVWALLGGALVVVLLGAALRPATGRRSVLVVRRGMVRAEVRDGLALRLGPWDRFVVADPDPDPLLLTVPGTTGDQQEVRLLLEVAWRPAPYPVGTPYRDPATALAEALEERLGATLGWLGVGELPHALTGHLVELRTGLEVPGAELIDLELAELDVLLRPEPVPDPVERP